MGFREYIAEQKRKRNKVLAGVFITAFLALVFFIWLNSGRYENPNGGNYFFEVIPDYSGQKVAMTKIDLLVEDGLAKIPLTAVNENKLIYTEYKNGPVNKIYY